MAAITCEVMASRLGPAYGRRVPATDGLGDELRIWRRRRGLSQLELSIRAEVSQRHVSFVETGRSRPSPDMVRRLADTLDIAPREQNRLLLLAGYAPAFPERPLDDLGLVSEVLDRILAAQHPHVAFVLDRAWNVLRANAAAGTFVDLAFPDRPSWLGPPLNVARASLHPDGLRRHMPRVGPVRVPVAASPGSGRRRLPPRASTGRTAG